MAVRNLNSHNNPKQVKLATHTVSVLAQTIGQIKKHGDNEKHILSILSHSIAALTSVIRPFIENDTIDTRLKN